MWILEPLAGSKNSRMSPHIQSQGSISNSREEKHDTGRALLNSMQGQEDSYSQIQPLQRSSSLQPPRQPLWDPSLCMPARRESFPDPTEGCQTHKYELGHLSTQQDQPSTASNDLASSCSVEPPTNCLIKGNSSPDLHQQKHQHAPGAGQEGQETFHAIDTQHSGMHTGKSSAVQTPLPVRVPTSPHSVRSEQSSQRVAGKRPSKATQNRPSQGRIVANEGQLGLLLGSHSKNTQSTTESSAAPPRSETHPQLVDSLVLLPSLTDHQFQSQFPSSSMMASGNHNPTWKYVAESPQSLGGLNNVCCHPALAGTLMSGNQDTFHRAPLYSGEGTYSGNSAGRRYPLSPALRGPSYAEQYENNCLPTWQHASRSPSYQSQRY